MEKTSSGAEHDYKKIFVFDAKPGMVLARDVFDTDGSIVAEKGAYIDIDMIAQIAGHHVLEIYVHEHMDASALKAAEAAKAAAEAADSGLTHFDKVRSGDEFKRFQDEYSTTVIDLKYRLNDILNGNNQIDTKQFLECMNTMMSSHSNNLRLMDMIHCLRLNSDLTYSHSINVALIASILGQWLHYSEEDVQALMLCGLLHDIGKLTISESILNKPSKLTAEEFEIMKTHVKGGYEQIKKLDIDPRIKEGCLLHHEKCDGSGYPFSLKSSQIPPFAKIIAIADIYDAMIANRVYRGAVCPFEVIHIMENETFSTLDPTFGLPFLKNVVSSYIHNNVKLSNGQLGEVILINDRDLSRPIVKCGDKFIDLSKTPGVSITAIL